MLNRPFLWVRRTSHQNSKYDSPLFQLRIYMQILIQPNKSVGWEGKSSSLKSLYLCEAVQNMWSMWDLRFSSWWWLGLISYMMAYQSEGYVILTG